MVDQLCEGSLTPILSHLLRNPRLSPQQKLQLRAMIEPQKRDDPDARRP
jgi:hypothetical protein